MDIITDEMRNSDWEMVRRIYLEGLETGQASFETAAPSWESWDSAHFKHSRLLVRQSDQVIAWAALAPTSRRSCYAGVAEASLYVSTDYHGCGIGKLLLGKLIESSERNGIWSLYGSTFPENLQSLRVQFANGFREVGRRERIARHNGVWRDTIITERRSRVVGV
jgi:phosphinothricin acetyltransferase